MTFFSNLTHKSGHCLRCSVVRPAFSGGGGWGVVLPYIGYVGMCGPKGTVFERIWSEKVHRF